MICLWDVDLSLEMSCNLISESSPLNGTWDNACFFIQTPGRYSRSTALYNDQQYRRLERTEGQSTTAPRAQRIKCIKFTLQTIMPKVHQT